LANAYNKKQILNDEIEPITRLIGIPQLSFKELNTKNIEDFNASVHNAESVTVFYQISIDN
jgi:hypothetical protein